MVTIHKNKKGEFFWNITGDNNEILPSTETVKQKQSVWKSIKATMEQMNSGGMTVIDKSEKVIKYYWVSESGKEKLIERSEFVKFEAYRKQRYSFVK